MKRILVCMLIACLLLGLTGCAGESTLFKTITEDDFSKWSSSDTVLEQQDKMLGLSNMTEMASADGLTLYMNKLTTEIAVKASDGTVWFSNPQNRLSYNKNRIGTYSSQLLITEIDASETVSVVNNFEESVQYGQFKIDKIDNGVSVEYLFGKKVETPLYPAAMTVEKFEEVLATIESNADQYKFKKYYGLMNMETIKDQQTIDAVKDKYANAVDLGQLRVLKNSPSQIERDNIIKYLTAAGFTEKDRDEQESLVGYTGTEDKTTYYTINMIYTIKDGRLVVDVPTENISASENITIQGIEILPLWNTANGIKSTNMLIPDGSGAIVEMNKPAAAGTSEYKERFYGKDYAQVQKNGTSTKYNLYFPVYGITNDDGALYGTIEKSSGSAYMSVEPCTSVDYTPGYGGFYFQLVDTEEVRMSEDQTVTTYANEAVLDEITVDYSFLPKTKNTWVDVAKDYKARLIKEEALSKAGSTEKMPVTIEFLGAIDDIKTVVGVPTEYIVPLTTFKQAKDLVGEIEEMLPDNSIIYQYDAWTDGGIKSRIQSKIKVESKLGKTSDLQALANAIKEAGSSFYPLVDTQYVYRNTAFDGFTTTGSATRGILREASFKADFNISNFMADADGFYGYLVSPKKMQKIMPSMLNSYDSKLDIDGLGLSYVATDLSSDFNRDDFITRNEAIDEIVARIAEASKDHSVLARGANAYALSNMDVASGVAMSSNASPLISYSVPFTQMILSGTMAYTADSWNLAADSNYYTLQCIETGSAPNFTAIYADNSLVKYTKYDQYYNVKFVTIKKSIQEVTNTVTDALSDVYGATICGYERVSDLVMKVSYDNGHCVYVNYGTKAFKTQDGVVEAGSYLKATTKA